MSLIPAPPQVLGPITPISPQVHLKGVFSGAELFVQGSQSGSLATTLYTDLASNIWLPFNVLPVQGEFVTASQRFIGDGDSGFPTGGGVLVEGLPSPLPCPRILRRLQNCSSSIDLDGLYPGAELFVSVSGHNIVDTTIMQDTENFPFNPTVGFAPGNVFFVHQTNPLDHSGREPCVTESLPVLELSNSDPLDAPVAVPPVIACTDSATFQNLVLGADLTIINEDQSFVGNDIDAGTVVVDLPSGFAWKQSTFTASQSLPRCKLVSPNSTGIVLPGPVPSAPTIAPTICAGVDFLYIEGLAAGEKKVFVQRLVAGHPELTSTIFQPTDDTTWDLPIPSFWSLIDPDGDVSFVAWQQNDCGTSLLSASVTVQPSLTSGAPPELVEPLYECARFIHVRSATPGCEMFASSSEDSPLSGSFIVPTDEFLIHTNELFELAQSQAIDSVAQLHRPLLADEVVSVHQFGCGIDQDSQTATVRAVATGGAPIPAPTVLNAPIFGFDTELVLGNILPGAEVSVSLSGPSIDDEFNTLNFKPVEAISEQVTLPLPAPRFPGEQYHPYQSICRNYSTLTNDSVNITRPDITIIATPNQVTKGQLTIIQFDLVNPAKNLENEDLWNSVDFDICVLRGGQAAYFMVEDSDTRKSITASLPAGPWNNAATYNVVLVDDGDPPDDPPDDPPENAGDSDVRRFQDQCLPALAEYRFRVQGV